MKKQPVAPGPKRGAAAAKIRDADPASSEPLAKRGKGGKAGTPALAEPEEEDLMCVVRKAGAPTIDGSLACARSFTEGAVRT